ncbi:MAG: hypothetical protein JWQ35_675 [Bacteriovoracaceae bacterium]|nr:hypothetical protein [Bacteriovoracaceae bacterium]
MCILEGEGRMKNKSNRGSIGLIAVLLVLLIVSYLAIKNFQKTTQSGITDPTTRENISTNAIIDRFKGDAKKIEDLQNRDLNPPTENTQ